MSFFKVMFYLLFTIIIVSCSNSLTYTDKDLAPEHRAKLLLNELTLEEKVGQMCQYVGLNHIKRSEKNASIEEIQNGDAKAYYKNLHSSDIEKMVTEGKIGSFLHIEDVDEINYLQNLAMQSTHKIPLFIAIDAIHGHGFYIPGATIFPTEIGMASSWDTTISKKIAEVTANEMRATGYHWTFSPNVEIATDPRWGRVGETFGEDPLVVSAHGVAMIKGYQGNLTDPGNVLACAKHFIAGGEPVNGLNIAPMDVSERRLKEIYFPPFEAAIDAGAATLMAAHNEINGMPCHANKFLLQEMLRDKWNFSGFVVSDWMDIERIHTNHKMAASLKEANKLAVEAGINIHMHGPGFYNDILELVNEGTLTEDRIDELVYPILKYKFMLGLFENPFVDVKEANKVLLTKEHQQLALESARKSIVLLENKNDLLPLSKENRRIFVTGPNANNQTILGDWSKPQPNENITTVFEGLQNMAPNSVIDYYNCGGIFEITDMVIAEAVARAKKAEVAILVVGENSLRHTKDKTGGENIARSDIQLPGRQEDLVKAIHKAGVPVIVVLVNGRPLGLEWIAENIPAVIESWEPGMHGGQAIAEVVFGDYNPGGKLPMTFSRSVGHITEYYNHRPSMYLRKYATGETGPLYPFGYGLSYTKFVYSHLKFAKHIKLGDDQQIEVTVSNSGKKHGDEVVLLYINDVYGSVTTPVKKLVAFKRISLKSGECQQVKMEIKSDQLALYNIELEKVIEPGEFEIIIGDNIIRESFFVE